MQFSDTTVPVKPKRKQVGRACSNCRHSKTACDEARPCTRCVARGMGATCVDAPKKRRTRKVNTDKPPPPKKQKVTHKETIANVPIAPKQISSPPPTQTPQITNIPSNIPPNFPTNLPINVIPLPNTNNNNNNTINPFLNTSPPLPCRIPSKDSLPSIVIDNYKSESDNNREKEENTSPPSLSKMDSSSTPFLSLKHPPSGIFHSNKLPPINSNSTQCELPFRTVAEPTVDLFSDSLHKRSARNLSISDEALELSGIRKNPSLETLFAIVLRETEQNNNEDSS